MSIIGSGYWMSSFMATFTTPRLVGPPLHIYGYMYLTAFFYLLGILLVVLTIPETKVGLILEY